MNLKTPMGIPPTKSTDASYEILVTEEDRKKYYNEGKCVSIGLKQMCEDKWLRFIDYRFSGNDIYVTVEG